MTYHWKEGEGWCGHCGEKRKLSECKKNHCPECGMRLRLSPKTRDGKLRFRGLEGMYSAVKVR